MLTFVQAVKICVFKKPFNWKDRASRSEFWWFNLFAFLVELALGILSVIPILGIIVGFLGFFVSIALWWLSLMASIRRLHDKDKSGFFLLLPTGALLLILVMSMIVVSTRSETLATITYITFILPFAASIYLLVLFVTRGTIGQNRFGQDPLEIDYSDITNDFSFQEAKRMFGDARNQHRNSNNQNYNNFNQNQGGFDPNQGGFNPNQGFDPSQNNGFNPANNGFNPNQGFDPSQNNGFNPANNGFNPNQGFDPSQNNGFNPANNGFNPNQGFDPSQNNGFNPANNGFNPNQGFGPSQNNGFNPSENSFKPDPNNYDPNKNYGFNPNAQNDQDNQNKQ